MRRVSKYRGKRTEYNGISYASKAEAARAELLDTLTRSGDVRWWLPQVTIQLGPDTRYRVDFLVSRKNGLVYAEDVKGRVVTPAFLRNKRMWRKYGQFPLRVVRRERDAWILHEVVVSDGGNDDATIR